MEMKNPAKAAKKRVRLFIIAIVAAVAILSMAVVASTVPFIGVNPVPPASTQPGSPPAATAPAPASANPAPQPVVVTPAPVLVQPKKTSSHNWVGYAVTGDPGSVSDVKGSWVVPAVSSATGTDGYSAFWVGIDGFNSHTVEQIGTESDYVDGSAQYYAWFEMYPHYPHDISMAVSPGDQISAEVKYAGNDAFILSISDLTSGQSFQTTATASAARSSAEWIAEAPYGHGILPLADFGNVNFNQGNYVTINGVTSPFGSVAPLYQIVMADSSGNVMAQPSPISSDGSGFLMQQMS